MSDFIEESYNPIKILSAIKITNRDTDAIKLR